MQPKFDAKATFEQIKANRAKLDACPRHAFGELPPLAFGVKLTCQRCGGALGAIEAAQYARGFESAGGNPDEIITNFRGDDTTPVTCPVCDGVCGVNVAEAGETEDWHDCDFCDCVGTVERAKALSYIDNKQPDLFDDANEKHF